MSPLHPKLQLQLLTELPSGLDGKKLTKQTPPSYSTLFRAAGLLATFSGLAMQAPSAWALDFVWGTAPFVWTPGNQTEVYQVGGVTFTFEQLDPSNVNANPTARPTNGNTLITANPNTPITGGLTRGNVLLGINSPTLNESLQLVMDATNAAGDRVPLDNATYSIIDIDRSCNRGDDVANQDEILWQDVVATRGLLGGATGTPVTPTLVGSTPTAGNVGAPSSASETVENITGGVGAGFTPDPGSVVFRGITDPTPETLTGPEAGVNDQGNGGCNAPPSGTVDNDDNRGVEASNNNAQPPGAPEGNVALSLSNSFTDRIEFEFGNGVAAGANNGLGETLTSDPAGHGIGVLGDLSFNPAIVGIAETSTAPVLQTTGAGAGQYLVTYTLRVTNPGETTLDNIEIENDLVTTFGSAAGFSVVPGSITGAAGGETFNGGDTTDISGGAITADNFISLAGPLAPGASTDVTFDVLIDSAVAGTGPFSNQSIVRANPVNSTTGVADTNVEVRDRSSNANDVASLNVDADQDDPDDGSTTNDGPSFANPFNATPGNINRDTAGDNDPSNNDSPTIVAIPENPLIGITKQIVGSPVPVAGSPGDFDITFRQIVRNQGNVALDPVQITDDLDTAFRVGTATGVTAYTVQPGLSSPAANPIAGTTGYKALVVDAGFDGSANPNILAAGNPTNSLAPGEFSVIEFTVRVTPGTNTGSGPDATNPPFDNQAEATGTFTPGGGNPPVNVTDLSDDRSLFPDGPGELPDDLNGDGDTTDGATGDGTPGPASSADTPNPTNPANPGTENDPTTISFTPETPLIGVTKQVLGTPVDNGNGTYTVTYRQIVSNLGTEALDNVSLDDQAFATTFRTGTATGVTSATLVGGSVSVPGAAPAGFPAGYTPLTGTPTFDGAGNLQLATVASLPVGGYGIVDYQVLVDPTDPLDATVENLGDGTLGGASPDDDNPYESQVTATGTGSISTTVVTDLSDDVTGFPLAADQLPRDLNGNGTATDPVDGTGAPQSSPIPADPTNDETVDENNRTPVTFTGSPAIALSKRITNVTANPDGTFDVTYRQLVQNIGPTPLDGVQITENQSIADDYRVGQPNGALGAVVQSVTAVPAGTIAAPGAPGAVTLTAGTPAGLDGSQTMLAGTDTLQPGEYGAVDYVVRVTPGDGEEGHGGGAAPFLAQATATGTNGGLTVSDPSDDGVEFPNGTTGVTPNQVLDPDNNGNADQGVATAEPIDPDGNTTTSATQSSENNPTPVRFPKLAIAKNISNVTGSGTPTDPYIVTYDVIVENVGGIQLNGVQVTEDNIDAVFSDLPPGDTTVIGPLTNTGGVPATVNPGFDGEGNAQLIDPANPLTLNPNQSSTFQYQVQVINPTENTDYPSSSTASGTGIPADGNGPVASNPLTVTGDANADAALETPTNDGILPVSDLSDDGTAPNPTPGDGNSGGGDGENDPTIARFPIGPDIGLTKRVISTTPNPDGSYDVTFEYRVENIGAVPLTGLDVVDNYDAQFPGVTNYEVISVTPGAAETAGGPTLAGSPGIVGSAPGSGPLTLAAVTPTVFDPAEGATTQVVVRVTPTAAQIANGTVFSGTATVTGTSTANADQVATDISDDNPLVPITDPADPRFTSDPGVLGAGGPDESGDDATPVVFEVPPLRLFKTITSTSRFGPINSQLPGAPAGVLGTDQVPDQLQPGDVVEYTIYYFNDAVTAFPGLEICDALPSPLTPVLPITGASFVNPLTPLPQADGTGRSCPDGTSGTQGAVIFPVGDVAPSSNGSVVFSTQIQ